MGFLQFVEIYMEDMKPRLKLNTFLTKKHIIDSKIIPYFAKKSLAEITATDVIQWQNQLLSMRDENDRPYSQTYLRTVQNQLSAIFNHACRFYGLSGNPSNQAGKMGKSKSREMMFWTKEEYLRFSEIMKDKPISFYAFEILYWTGIREGELLALERGDIDLESRKLNINKSYQRLVLIYTLFEVDFVELFDDDIFPFLKGMPSMLGSQGFPQAAKDLDFQA